MACEKPVAGGARTRALKELHEKVGGISVLDPAAGSGNFLTESYLCLRRLENNILLELQGAQNAFSFEELGDHDVLVSLRNFHGIELEDFACCVARTALWIAEKQADADTAKVTQRVYQELPLTDYEGIVNANALRIDWNDVVPASEVDYIIGNPPFIGARNQSSEQKSEMLSIFGDARNAGNIDYCGAWYAKACEFTRETSARCAFVSTNSVCQGEQVANLWKPLFDDGVHIDFAHRSFVWNSAASDEAHVHVIIVGFSHGEGKRHLFEEGAAREVDNINAYLVNAPDEFVWNRRTPLCDVPSMGIGNKPIDGGNYLFSDEEKEAFLAQEPDAERFFHPWIGSREFLHSFRRWCLWLGDATFSDIKSLPLCRERIQAVREYRLASSSAPTRQLAERPTRFHVENMPTGSSIVIPKVSSQKRRYIPLGFIGPETLCSDLVFLVPNATLYHFGILHSIFHIAWMRTVCGRLKSDYRYSAGVVYNNFVWPEPSEEQRKYIESCAQTVLDARAGYPDASLADMYNPDNDFLFPELMKAHAELDAAVEAAYGVDFNGNEEKIVAHLFKLYAEKTGEEGQ